MSVTSTPHCQLCHKEVHVPITIKSCKHILGLNCIVKSIYNSTKYECTNNTFSCPIDLKIVPISDLTYTPDVISELECSSIIINSINSCHSVHLKLPLATTIEEIFPLLHNRIATLPEKNISYIDHAFQNIFKKTIFNRSHSNGQKGPEQIKVAMHHPSFCKKHPLEIKKASEVFQSNLRELGFDQYDDAIYWANNF
ncbi:MAG: hypothetical protein VX777_04220 [Chlamydiota bacterium]|nr:hypothetical protein [Chlamydiota bacterium]